MDISDFSNSQFGKTEGGVRNFLLYLQSLDDNLDTSDSNFLDLVKNRCGAISIKIIDYIHSGEKGVYVEIFIPEIDQEKIRNLTTIKVPKLSEAIPFYDNNGQDNFLIYIVIIEPERAINTPSRYTGNISEYRQLLNSRVDVVPFRPLAYTMSYESDLFIRNGITVDESNIDNFIPIDFADKYYPLFIPINKTYRSKKNVLRTLRNTKSAIQIAANFYINI